MATIPDVCNFIMLLYYISIGSPSVSFAPMKVSAIGEGFASPASFLVYPVVIAPLLMEPGEAEAGIAMATRAFHLASPPN